MVDTPSVVYVPSALKRFSRPSVRGMPIAIGRSSEDDRFPKTIEHEVLKADAAEQAGICTMKHNKAIKSIHAFLDRDGKATPVSRSDVTAINWIFKGNRLYPNLAQGQSLWDARVTWLKSRGTSAPLTLSFTIPMVPPGVNHQQLNACRETSSWFLENELSPIQTTASHLWSSGGLPRGHPSPLFQRHGKPPTSVT